MFQHIIKMHMLQIIKSRRYPCKSDGGLTLIFVRMIETDSFYIESFSERMRFTDWFMRSSEILPDSTADLRPASAAE